MDQVEEPLPIKHKDLSLKPQYCQKKKKKKKEFMVLAVCLSHNMASYFKKPAGEYLSTAMSKSYRTYIIMGLTITFALEQNLIKGVTIPSHS
jgi:hypothetical protein